MLDIPCDNFMPEGQPCELPFRPGTYGHDVPIEVTLPEIPAFWDPFLQSKIKSKLFGIKPDGSKTFCVSVTFEFN